MKRRVKIAIKDAIDEVAHHRVRYCRHTIEETGTTIYCERKTATSFQLEVNLKGADVIGDAP